MARLEDEYGVYERLAVLETEVSAIKHNISAGHEKPEKSDGLLGSLNPITWILIAATALGNGPEVLQLIIKVLGSAH